VSRRFPIAARVEGWVVFFVVVASGVDVTVGEVLTESCDCFFECFISGERWSGTEGES